jgi:hypothetical protein
VVVRRRHQLCGQQALAAQRRHHGDAVRAGAAGRVLGRRDAGAQLSIPEQAARVASGVVDSLKQQPLSLALVIMNLALLAILYYALSVSVATRQREFDAIMSNQKEMREASRDIRQNMVPESEMRDVQRTLRDKLDEIKGDLRDCEAKINRKVDDTLKHNGAK